MFALFKWKALFSSWDIFAVGFAITVLVSLISLIATLSISLIVGIIRCSNLKKTKKFANWYISFFQNTPLVVQIIFLYNVLPHLGIVFSPFICGCIGLSLYTGAFGATVIEAAILAVPKGQFEASYSQGMSYLQSMYHIILPQAAKIALPPMTNQTVNLIKNSSVLAMIAGGDLMYRADSWAGENLFYGPSFIITGLLYLSLCLPLSKFAQNLEKKVKAK
ncbi:MAG: amino acid ABC transporter permease [Elusimicrobiota bacterium]|nr:amino acid ABC transporter permease [Elusimicrobiota bacterium]